MKSSPNLHIVPGGPFQPPSLIPDWSTQTDKNSSLFVHFFKLDVFMSCMVPSPGPLKTGPASKHAPHLPLLPVFFWIKKNPTTSCLISIKREKHALNLYIVPGGPFPSPPSLKCDWSTQTDKNSSLFVHFCKLAVFRRPVVPSPGLFKTRQASKPAPHLPLLSAFFSEI